MNKFHKIAEEKVRQENICVGNFHACSIICITFTGEEQTKQMLLICIVHAIGVNVFMD